MGSLRSASFRRFSLFSLRNIQSRSSHEHEESATEENYLRETNRSEEGLHRYECVIKRMTADANRGKEIQSKNKAKLLLLLHTLSFAPFRVNTPSSKTLVYIVDCTVQPPNSVKTSSEQQIKQLSVKRWCSSTRQDGRKTQ